LCSHSHSHLHHDNNTAHDHTFVDDYNVYYNHIDGFDLNLDLDYIHNLNLNLNAAPTCTPTPYEQFQNGDFECGSLYPWRALVTEGTTYALTSPGSTGAFAFEVDQNAPLDSVGIGEAILAQLFYITPGTQYVLTFDTFFNVGNGGFIGVKFNGAPKYTVDASDNLRPGVWNSNTISFTATTGQYFLEFEFMFGTSSVVAKIDNVILSPPT
jgi:hypothetical protein